MIVALPPMLGDLAGLGSALRSSRALRSAGVPRFAAWPLRDLIVEDSGRVAALNDGIELIRRASLPGETVANLDFANPFNFAFERPPYRGGSTAMQYSFTYSDRHKPTPEWLLGGADIVMVPRKGVLSLEPFLRNYGEFFYGRFRLAAESQWWKLYRQVR